MLTYAYGFPRLGREREYKKQIESFWKKEIDQKQLIGSLDEIEQDRLDTYKRYVDLFPSGEFTYYDNILDTALIFGVYTFNNLNKYFSYARGRQALNLKKYFNTNYHYLVPEINQKCSFSIKWNKPLFYFNTFFSFNEQPLHLVGPYTFLKLSKTNGNFETLLSKITNRYSQLIKHLAKKGVKTLHIEEPAFVQDLTSREISLIIKSYRKILNNNVKVNIITYYESFPWMNKFYDLPFNAIGLDFVDGKEDNLKTLKAKGFPKDKKLICGVVDGRNPRRAHVLQKLKLVESIGKIAKLPQENMMISNSCPLQHLPITIQRENRIKQSIKNKISFAQERLYELSLIKQASQGNLAAARKWSKNIRPERRRVSGKKFATGALTKAEFRKRKKVHKELYNLPLLPTTTIGSFPQDSQLRKTRLKYKKRKISYPQYQKFIKNKIHNVVELQKKSDLDVLVHGEFERTDMVEFFSQKLKGFVTTDNGWVISYGTRGYRPPIIYDEIKRTKPLTVKETKLAQKYTDKPVKGIFTGPVTIIAWSYNMRDTSLPQISVELARALKQEAKDLLKNNINFIQIDEPAIKEFAPLRKKDHQYYFSWAVRAFNLSAKLPQKAQVHTHMCYSEFGDILKWILKMNFDVITIEAAREGANIVKSFAKMKFSRQIGPGVWDIHSSYPAEETRIEAVLKKAIDVFGVDNLWLNPDCGLKTRDWPEVKISLARITKIAKKYRRKYKK
jgi:5-methyltetrahydropteroyltriglutamate--homocysteine methyltransferase